MFELDELFDSFNWDFDIQKSHINWLWDYVITSWLGENWILWKTDIEAKIFDKNSITVDMFWFVFFRQFNYKIVTHARVFSLQSKTRITNNQWLFLANSLNFLSKKFGYENMCSWSKIKKEKIQLPIKNWKIDFDFMESFIEDLQKQKIEKLNNYLKVTWLKDYNLTENEKEVLEDLRNNKINWREFYIGWNEWLFEKLNLKFLKLKFDKDKDTSKEKTEEFNLPLVNAKDWNNWIMYYWRSNDFDSDEMTIDIVNDWAISTGNVYPQPQKTWVLYNAYLIKSKINITKNILHFFSSTIKKSIKLKFWYENKASWNKVKDEKIQLPIKDNKPDYELMEVLISSIQKTVIKDVVNYTDWKVN